jgi:hypothetical protein
MTFPPDLFVPHLFSTRQTCPVPGCRQTISRRRVMCWRHWLTVRPWLRAKVWRVTRNIPGTPPHIAVISEALQRAQHGPPPSLWSTIKQLIAHH